MGKKDLKTHVQGKKKGVWKGGKRTHYTYEGTQYTGGRVEGRKNLTKLENGNVLNQHGVEFTQADKKKLENLVNRANAKRSRMIKEEGALPRLVGGKPTGQNVSTLQQMGKESDFIISRKSKSMQRFTSREQYEKYVSHLEQVNSPDYIEEKTRAYKRNHMKALKEAFGDEANDVIMKIRMMKPADYRKMIQSDEEMEISYFYSPEDRAGKLNQIRASMGMNLKEEYYDE